MENCKKYEKEETSLSTVREKDPAGGEQSGPNKQSKLLDCINKMMLEMSIVGLD